MKIVHYATQNKAKVGSLKKVLSRYGIEVVHADIDLSLAEPRIDDVRVIAEKKVMAAFKQIRKPVVALDAGCYIGFLDGFPGVFVNHALKTIGVEGILKLLEGKARDCEFIDCLAYFDGKRRKPVLFGSNVIGVFADSPRGETSKYSWSVLSRIFIPVGEKKTLAEMTDAEYAQWSEKHHQDSYAAKFAKWFLAQKEATQQ